MTNTDMHVCRTQMPEVLKKLDFLHAQGFKSQLYASSVRFHKILPTHEEEISVRSSKLENFQVEFTQIRKTRLGRKVKSGTHEGQIADCVSFIQGVAPRN